ncbi:S49 family peptidase, partial [Thioclava sp. BHET1]
MSRLPFLSQRIFNTPVAILPSKAEVIIAALHERLGVMRPQATLFIDDEERSAPRSGYDSLGGVAIIQVEGTLVQKNGYLRPYSGMTGYDGIRQNFLTALSDPAISAIAFNINSPGGEVSGCFDLVDEIYQARGEKPIWAILDDCAFSAAYAIASACDRITVPRTGGVGSIGVV